MLNDSIHHAMSFNTASGKYCCNPNRKDLVSPSLKDVSIPQAVSTVATEFNEKILP